MSAPPPSTTSTSSWNTARFNPAPVQPSDEQRKRGELLGRTATISRGYKHGFPTSPRAFISGTASQGEQEKSANLSTQLTAVPVSSEYQSAGKRKKGLGPQQLQETLNLVRTTSMAFISLSSDQLRLQVLNGLMNTGELQDQNRACKLFTLIHLWESPLELQKATALVLTHLNTLVKQQDKKGHEDQTAADIEALETIRATLPRLTDNFRLDNSWSRHEISSHNRSLNKIPKLLSSIFEHRTLFQEEEVALHNPLLDLLNASSAIRLFDRQYFTSYLHELFQEAALGKRRLSEAHTYLTLILLNGINLQENASSVEAFRALLNKFYAEPAYREQLRSQLQTLSALDPKLLGGVHARVTGRLLTLYYAQLTSEYVDDAPPHEDLKHMEELYKKIGFSWAKAFERHPLTAFVHFWTTRLAPQADYTIDPDFMANLSKEFSAPFRRKCKGDEEKEAQAWKEIMVELFTSDDQRLYFRKALILANYEWSKSIPPTDNERTEIKASIRKLLADQNLPATPVVTAWDPRSPGTRTPVLVSISGVDPAVPLGTIVPLAAKKTPGTPPPPGMDGGMTGSMLFPPRASATKEEAAPPPPGLAPSPGLALSNHVSDDN